MPLNVAAPEQIELTREVLALKSYDETKSRIEVLASAQWMVQVADNALWTKNRNIFGKLDGKVKFDAEAALERIRTRSRERFGLDADLDSPSGNFVSSLQWF